MDFEYGFGEGSAILFAFATNFIVDINKDSCPDLEILKFLDYFCWQQSEYNSTPYFQLLCKVVQITGASAILCSSNKCHDKLNILEKKLSNNQALMSVFISTKEYYNEQLFLMTSKAIVSDKNFSKEQNSNVLENINEMIFQGVCNGVSFVKIEENQLPHVTRRLNGVHFLLSVIQDNLQSKELYELFSKEWAHHRNNVLY